MTSQVTIKINNLDTPFTIDTYGMFNGESSEEGEAEYYEEELGFTGEIDFDYDHKSIVSELADYSVFEILRIVDRDVLVNISEPLSTSSPSYYNYTTDSYVSEWTVNKEKLLEAVKDLTIEDEDFQTFQLNSSWGLLDSESEDYIVCALDFWGRQYTEEYNENMWEHESEIYYNNRKPSAEMQAELDKLEATKKV
jgi:hypothetical protein